MKLIFYFFTFILFTYKSNCQNSTSIYGCVKYIQIIATDKDILGEESKASLYFTNESASYVYNRFEDAKDNQVLPVNVGGGKAFYDSIGNVTYKDLVKKKMISREIVSRKNIFIIEEDSLPVFKWEIKPEQKSIGNLACRKAITYYKGRNYEAWFAPSIPVNQGPWKFYGLPGLIIEVYDDKRAVQFLFKSIEIPSDHIENFLHIPSHGKRATWSEVKRVEVERVKEIERRFLSALPRDIHLTSFVAKVRTPIELED